MPRAGGNRTALGTSAVSRGQWHMSEAPAKRAKLAVEGVNGSSPGSASAHVASPRRAARAVVDPDAELMEADNAAANGEEAEITEAMAAENAKCDTPSHHHAH